MTELMSQHQHLQNDDGRVNGKQMVELFPGVGGLSVAIARRGIKTLHLSMFTESFENRTSFDLLRHALCFSSVGCDPSTVTVTQTASQPRLEALRDLSVAPRARQPSR